MGLFDRALPLGDRGERMARRFLKKRGMKILARNFRCPAGEADIVALDPSSRSEHGCDTLVIVEVKTRADDRHTAPYAAVDAAKQRRLRRIGQTYRTQRRAFDCALRFDIVSIVLRPGARPEITHLRQAF